MILNKQTVEPDIRDFADIPRDEGREQSAQLLLFLLSAHGDKFTAKETQLIKNLIDGFKS